MQGNYIKNCSCDPGCPCDFNAEPTHHHCEGMAGMEIASGNFGDVSLDGLKWAATYRWPGPLHEGHGTLQPFIDANASEEQRTALLTILSGQVGGTFFEILAAIVDTFLDPQFVQIDFTADVDARRARMNAHGGFETESLPIMNPVTKEEHRVLVQMPEGFEYRLAEIGSAASIESNSGIPLHITNGHSSLARVTFAP
jgi:hypothetical protein